MKIESLSNKVGIKQLLFVQDYKFEGTQRLLSLCSACIIRFPVLLFVFPSASNNAEFLK